MSRESRIARALRTAEGETYKPLDPVPAARFSWHPSEEDVLRAQLHQARQAADAEEVYRITLQLNALVP